MKAYVYYYLNKANVIYDIADIMGFTENALTLMNVVFCFLDRNYSRYFQILKETDVDYVKWDLLFYFQ